MMVEVEEGAVMESLGAAAAAAANDNKVANNDQ